MTHDRMSCGIVADKGQALTDKSRIILWRFVDGKPGHDNQSLGLSRALAERIPIQEHILQVPTQPHYLINWLIGRLPDGDHLPAPQLILGAGHATHYPMLRTRKKHGGKIITMMRPSLPLRWFDLCILPEHDYKTDRETNTFITRGAINAIQRAPDPCTDQGIFLIGGPSNHYHWDNKQILKQIAKTIQTSPDILWSLTTSRRTPENFIQQLEQLVREIPQGLAIFPHQQTDRNWLAQQLHECATVYVSTDSVSMIYEALTAGAKVGLLELKAKMNDRVAQSIQGLVDDGWIQLNQPSTLPTQSMIPEEFNEATRCARWIDKQWLENSP